MEEVFPDRVKYWLTEAQHDCFFIVGLEDEPTERIGAIKPLLMGDSLPFRAMLQDSELAEKGDIRLKDVEPETFKNFLKCVYGASGLLIPKLTFEECLKLLYISEKYLVSGFRMEIIRQIRKQNISSLQNIYIAVSHPVCYQNTFFELKIRNFLKYNFTAITKNEQFLELSKASIIWILHQESFNVKEIQIWDAILRWVKQNSNSSDGKVIRSHIFDCLTYFRFLTMEYTEFWNGVVSSEVLLEEEVNDICRALVSGNPCTMEHLCNSRRNRYYLGLVSENITSSFAENTKCATISCSVRTISELKTYPQCSKTYPWAGHLWSLIIFKDDKKGQNNKLGLSAYLICQGQTSQWECSVVVEISLIHQDEKFDKKCNYTEILTPNSNFCGQAAFIDWDVLLNPSSGFVKDDTIDLMVKIRLKNP